MSGIADFIVKISVDGKQATIPIDEIGKSVEGLKARFNSFKALIVGGSLGLLGKKFLDEGDALQALSDKTGVSTDALQVFGLIAKETNTSIDAFANALKKLAIAQVGAQGENKDALAAFQRFGIGMDDLKSKTPEQLFYRIGEAVRTGGITTQRLADTISLMGRSADDVLPAMRTNMAEFAEQAKKAGLLMDELTVKTLAAQKAAFERSAKGAEMTALPLITTALAGIDFAGTFLKASPRIAQGLFYKLTGDKQKQAEADAKWMSIMNPMLDRYDPAKIDAAQRMKTFDSSAIERAKQIAELREKNEKTIRDLIFDRLDAQEKMNLLLTQEDMLKKEILKTTDELKKEELVASLAEVERKLTIANKAPDLNFTPTRPTVDELAKIGLFRGGFNDQLSAIQKQLQVQAESLEELRAINRSLNE